MMWNYHYSSSDNEQQQQQQQQQQHNGSSSSSTTTTTTTGLSKAQFQLLSLCVLLLQCVHHVDAFIGKNKKKKQQEQQEAEERALAEQQAAESAALEAAAKNTTVFGITMSKTVLVYLMCAGTELFALCLLLLIVNTSSSSSSSSSGSDGGGSSSSTKSKDITVTEKTKKFQGNNPSAELDVIIVGCGLPKRGMGWYHMTQLLDMKNVNMKAVVEPFFMNPDLCPKMPPAFAELVTKTSKLGVQFAKSVEELPRFEKKTVCLVAGRTADNPKFFQKCLDNGASCVYLEKPGAPSVAELKDMKAAAEIFGTTVYLGYNKNVTPYVTKALAKAKTIKQSRVSFVHNNSYQENELTECFERNSEGLLKNMAVHELALLVTFFGVTVETIKEFKVFRDKSVSHKLTLGKRTDFSKASFQITTTDNTIVGVRANRCGGNVSWATVLDNRNKEVARFEFPDAQTQSKVDAQAKADPEMMPYFFVQSDDYLELKKRVVDACLTGKPAEGVATITVAIEALKLAEYATEKLNKEL